MIEADRAVYSIVKRWVLRPITTSDLNAFDKPSNIRSNGQKVS